MDPSNTRDPQTRRPSLVRRSYQWLEQSGDLLVDYYHVIGLFIIMAVVVRATVVEVIYTRCT